MIKTDKVIYRTRTQEEYDWLMEKLEEAGCKWVFGGLPTAPKEVGSWKEYLSETCIRLDDQMITYANFNFYKNASDYKDYEFIEVSDLMGNEEKKNLIKTDKVIYRTRTLEEYNWLMQELERGGCEWGTRKKPTEFDAFSIRKSDTHIFVYNKALTCGGGEHRKTFYKGQEFIEVSDLMETEEETDAIEELEAIHKQLTNQIGDLRKQGKEPKSIEYTIEVCFE